LAASLSQPVATRRGRKAGAAQVLEPAEGVLDQVATTVALLVIADDALAVATAWDDGDSAGVTKRAAQPGGIVALVALCAAFASAEQVAHAPGPFEQGRCGLHVADIGSGERQRIDR